MEDVSLHSPVVRSSGPHGQADMGQFTYDDEDDAYTPRRIWPAQPRYAARVLGPREYPAAVSPRRPEATHNALFFLTALGLVVFACSTASLVIVAVFMNSARVQITSATDQLARSVSLIELWLGNATLARPALSVAGY